MRWWIASVVALGIGCASTAPPAVSPSPADGELPDTAPIDTAAVDADRCIAAASTEPFAPFTAPVPSDAFRRHMARRVQDLACCFTDARRRDIAGTSLQVTFEGRTTNADDGAVGRILEPDDPARPEERRCLQAIASAWVMTPAPRSDVVRPGESAARSSIRVTWSLRQLAPDDAVP